MGEQAQNEPVVANADDKPAAEPSQAEQSATGGHCGGDLPSDPVQAGGGAPHGFRWD